MNSRVVRGAVIGIEGNAYFEAAHAMAARRGGRCCATYGRSSPRPA